MENNKRDTVITIMVGDYMLKTHDDDSFWLQHKDGEGMTIWNHELAKLLDDYAKENF